MKFASDAETLAAMVVTTRWLPELVRRVEPVRLDPRLFDEAFAEKKLGEVVESRLAMVRALNETRKVGEVAGKIQKLGGKYGTYRIWEYEP